LKFATPPLLEAILKSANVTQACNDYIGIRSYGIIFTLIAIAFRSFYIGISITRIITYSAFIMMIVNVILDYVLIFGNYGFPEMGIKGAALASVIAEFTGAAYLIIYSFFKKEFIQFNLFRFQNMGMERINAIFNISAPLVLQNGLSMGAWFLFFVFIERMGEHELAISNVIRATYMILMTPIWGFASATNSMVSNIVGQGKQHEVRSLVLKIVQLSMITTVILFLASLISPQWLLRITTNDQQLITDALGCYYIIVGAMFLFSASVILLNVVSGLGNTKAAMYIELVNIFIYMTYVYICAVILESSIEWVWFSEILYWVLMGLFSYWYLTSKKMETRRVIKSMITLICCTAILAFGCKTPEKTAPSPPEPGSVSATVIDMRELDGCTYLLELQDGMKLQPTAIPVEYQQAGLKVRVKYKKVEIMSICMSGTPVELTYIKAEK
jgi:putative MATE family efflux protein